MSQKVVVMDCEMCNSKFSPKNPNFTFNETYEMESFARDYDVSFCLECVTIAKAYFKKFSVSEFNEWTKSMKENPSRMCVMCKSITTRKGLWVCYICTNRWQKQEEEDKEEEKAYLKEQQEAEPYPPYF